MGIFKKMEYVDTMHVKYNGKEWNIEVYLTTQMHGIKYGYADGNKIVISDVTYTIPDPNIRQFIINHEVGHIVCGHTAITSSVGRIVKGLHDLALGSAYDAINAGRTLEDEYAADAVAYSINAEGTMLGLMGLYTIDSVFPWNMKSYQELKLRYIKLGGNADDLQPLWYLKSINDGTAENEDIKQILALQENVLNQKLNETVQAAQDILDNRYKK